MSTVPEPDDPARLDYRAPDRLLGTPEGTLSAIDQSPGSTPVERAEVARAQARRRLADTCPPFLRVCISDIESEIGGRLGDLRCKVAGVVGGIGGALCAELTVDETRVVRASAGVRVASGLADGVRLQQAMESALADARLRRGAERVRDSFAAAGGAGAAADRWRRWPGFR